MIADAQKCEPLDVSNDEWIASDITAGVNEFVASLARGEYAEELYWECQGSDFEEEGQWLQALDAYQTILDLESSSDFDRFRACNSMAALYRILGDDEAVLQHLQSATHLESAEPRTILWANSVVNEAWQLLRMGRIAEASQQLDHLHGSPDAIAHEFAQANLLTVRAACCVAQGDARRARRYLHETKVLLAALDESPSETMESAPGVVDAYSTWGAVEAECCRLVGDHKAELQALRESLKLAEQLASDDPISVVHAEYTVMRRLLDLAAVCDRQCLAGEAAEHRARAEQICVQRKFPQAAKRIFSLQPEKPLSTWQRLLNRF
jgi:tetratricopeptide (TPR) repeat protein